MRIRSDFADTTRVTKIRTYHVCRTTYLRSSRDCSFDMGKIIIIDYLNEFDHEIVEDFALYSVYTRSLTTGYQPAVYM